MYKHHSKNRIIYTHWPIYVVALLRQSTSRNRINCVLILLYVHSSIEKIEMFVTFN